MLFSHLFLNIHIIHDVKASKNKKFQFSDAIYGVYRAPKVGFFFSKFVKRLDFHYYSAVKKATATVLVWGARGYSPIHFEYKTAS